MPGKVTGLTGTVIMEEKGLELKNLGGGMANGGLRLSGSVDWHEDPVQVSFSFEGRKLLLSLERTAKALVDTDLSLTGDFDELSLGGRVDIIKGRFFQDFDDREARGKLKKRYFPEKEVEGEGGKRRKGPDLGKVALDLQVNAPDRFWISNSMAEVENSISLHLGGTVGAPELDGEVRLLRGEIVYLSRRFTLYSGRIYNAPPGLEPMVEAQAEEVVGDTRIYLLLEGPLHRPKLQLTSIPPRSQEDLISLLTVGYTRSSLEEQESEALAIGAALVFTGPLIEEVEEGARELAGIEIFQVEPTFGDDGGAAKVTVGTRLSDRLYMSASQSVGVTEDQQVHLEYQVMDYLSVIGQQLEQGIYSLDMVLQFDFD
jgi:translocation and assembly module TamB